MIRINSIVGKLSVAAFLAALMIPAATVHSAVLVEIDGNHVAIEGGERIDSTELISRRAIPGEIDSLIEQTNVQTPSESDGESALPQWAWSSLALEIQPEAGEEIGDDVCYSFEVTQTATTSVDGDALAVAEVGGGTDSIADAGVDPFFVEAEVETGFSLEVNGQTVMGPRDYLSISGTAAESLQFQGHFLIQIGDVLGISHAVANAAAAEYPGTAESFVSSHILILETNMSNCLVAFTDDPGAPGPLAMAGITGTSDTASVGVTNTGAVDSPLQVGLDSISAGYNIAGGLPISDIEPGDAAVNVNVECVVPQAPGTLMLETSDPASPTVSYDLTCEAVDPAFEGIPGAPGPLVLTSPASGTASMTLEVFNAGDAGSPLDVGLDSISAGYSLPAGLPIAGLEVTDSAAEILIECAPPQAAGSLALATNDPTNATVVYDVECVLETFTVGGMVSGLEGDQVVLQNNAVDDQAVTADGGFTFSPQADGTDYLVTVATQPSDPGQTCTVTNGSGTLAGENVTNVEVSCETILVELDQSALEFGAVSLGDSETQAILVTNSGAAELGISAISHPGTPFFLAGGSCLAFPLTLAPMETCTIDVQFLPEQDGSFASSFQIESNADSSPDSVALTGEAMPLLPVLPVPTLGHWALIVLALSLLLVAGWRLRMS